MIDITFFTKVGAYIDEIYDNAEKSEKTNNFIFRLYIEIYALTIAVLVLLLYISSRLYCLTYRYKLELISNFDDKVTIEDVKNMNTFVYWYGSAFLPPFLKIDKVYAHFRTKEEMVIWKLQYQELCA